MPDVHDPEVEEVRGSWVIRVLYLGLIAANLYLVADWWAETDQGRATIERWKGRVEALKVKAENCEGCARRKARLQAAINRVHFDAEQIVEGKDVETIPEQP